jgi:FkbM family methyltransferase
MPRSHLLGTKGFNRLAKGRDGYYLYNRNDEYIGRAIERYGEYSAQELNFLKKLCRPGDVVIEVGANIGAHTVGLAKHIGRTGRILAFEPQRLVFQTLCANVALNNLTNVDCYLAAAGKADGRMIVPELDPTRRNNFGGVSLTGAAQGLGVDCVALDRFVSLPRLRLVKIDVEGMEADVLAGGQRLIEKFRPILYVENDRVEKSEALLHLIDDLGYGMSWHLPLLFNPYNFYSARKNIFPDIVSVNLLCAHREEKTPEGFVEIKDFTFHPMRRKTRTRAHRH